MADAASIPLSVDVVTEFPEMIRGFLSESMIGRASRKGAVRFRIVNPRDFTEDKRHTTDDRPYGGGPGMIMLPDPLVRAVESVREEGSKVLLMTPSGKPFVQADAHRLAQERHLIFLCGHYEGIDDRVRQILQPEEISIGDYVLTNGALPAACVIDATVRLLPGVLGGDGATQDESFETGLLDFPQFTHPVEYRGLRVPEVLQSGNHAKIRAWRQEQAERLTLERRPDLAAKAARLRPFSLPRTDPPRNRNQQTYNRRNEMSNVLDEITAEGLKKDVPEFAIGDQVKVYVKIKEGDKTRDQAFGGVVIARKGAGANETFTVRHVAYGVGVEKVFPVHSPFISKIVVEAHSHVRRAKLYFLRDRKGKAARLRSTVAGGKAEAASAAEAPAEA